MSQQTNRNSNSKRKGNLKQIWNSVKSEDLTQAYQISLTHNPQFHHPDVVDGTADKETFNYDFLTWCSGVRSCMGDSRLKAYISMSQRQGQPTQQRTNLPQNVNQAISRIRKTVMTVQQRSAA